MQANATRPTANSMTHAYHAVMATFLARRLCAFALVPLLSPSAVAAQEADVIVRNARIWTGDTLRPSAQAVAIRGDRLIAVGTNADVDAHRTSRTRVIDAGGRVMTPGDIDDHTHVNQAGALHTRPIDHRLGEWDHAHSSQPLGSQRVAREWRGARAREPDVRTTCRGTRVRERARDRARG